MDLHFLDARPSDEERAAVDAVLGPPSSGWSGGERTAPDAHVAFGGREAAQALRPQLLPVLHAVNDRVGWVSQGALNYVAQRLEVPPAEAYGVLTFYALLSPVARPPRVVHVCTDLACRMRDVHGLTAGARPRGRAAARRRVAWHSVAVPRRLRAGAGRAWWSKPGVEPRVEVVAPAIAPTRSTRCSVAEPPRRARRRGVRAAAGRRRRSCSCAASAGPTRPRSPTTAPTAATRRSARALDLGPAGVIREVTDAKLPGPGRRRLPDRPQVGGGRRPARPPPPPGLQRRRVRAGHVQGPRAHGGRPVRGRRGDDDRRAHHRVRARLPVPPGRVPARPPAPRARHRGGPPARLPRRRRDGQRPRASTSSLFRGAGAYICGEETAIFNSIEGYRGEPRNKPPFPVEVGLFGQPTLVNNVETLVNVLPILEQGGPAYAAIGTEGSTGHQAVLRLGLRRPARACTRCPSASRWASCWRWPAACPTAARCGPCCSAARPAASSGPTSWTCRSRSRGPGRRAPRSARAW